jgi:hypothetical protein
VVKLGTEIKIYVVKTELLKDKSILGKNALNLLDALKEELINLYDGLSPTCKFIGYWKDSTKTAGPWVNGHICNIEKDYVEIWQILTDKDLLAIENKSLASKTFQIIQCIKQTTKQKSQLITINRNIEINYS